MTMARNRNHFFFVLRVSFLFPIAGALRPIAMSGRDIAKRVPATNNGFVNRLVGTVDVDGAGTEHPLEQVDPFMLLDQATVAKDAMPPFGSHPHRGHSVVTALLQGRVMSWDSVTQRETVVEGPASYLVDAGSGLFHDERTVIPDEGDPDQHAVIFQLWMSVREADRSKPPSLQYDENLPVSDVVDDDGEVVGNIRYFAGGANTRIKTMHPILVGLVTQRPGTSAMIPLEDAHGGFAVHWEGRAAYGNHKEEISEANDVLVLADAADGTAGFLRVTTSATSGGCRYLVCVGERIGEPWFKKLGSNGAIVARCPEVARAIASRVEEDGTFALR